MPQITVGDVKRAIAKESGAIPARTRGRFVTRKARSRTLVAQAAGVFCASIVLLTLVVPAQARPARCVTDDEGSYRCDFKMTDSDGSFEVSARGKPTYMLVMESPGVALGFVNIGRRNIALPGRYKRSTTDRSCWINDSTAAKICAK